LGPDAKSDSGSRLEGERKLVSAESEPAAHNGRIDGSDVIAAGEILS
jgi:hypothetical protein